MEKLALIATGSFLVAFSGAASPGPVLTITLAESARRGFKVGPLIVLGHAILEIPVVVAVVLGLGEILKGPMATKILGLGGGGVLVWLAWQTYRDSLVPFSPGEGTAVARGWIDLPIKGILTSLSNPYWFLWWATIGMAYMTIALGKGWWGILAFYLGHILADLAWYAMVSGLVASGRRFMGTRTYAWLLKGCATVLLVFAVYFFSLGVR